MDANDLRELADALADHFAVSRESRKRAADYLRACADAKPVRAVPIGHALSAVRHVGSANYPDRERAAIERLYSAEFDAYAHPAPAVPQWVVPLTAAYAAVDDVAAADSPATAAETVSNLLHKQAFKAFTHPAPAAPAGWKLVPVEPTPEMLDEGCDVDARAEVIKKYAAMPVIRNPENCCSCGEMLAVQYRAMLAAAPAAPQAEPCIGNDSACPCQDGDACHYKDAADGTKAWPVPQAEPKREPLSDEQIELPDYLRLQIASTAAAHDVLVERRRQIEVEGWTPEHDDGHVLGELAALAAFYAVPDGVRDWDFSSTGYGDTLAEALLPNGWTAKAGEDRRRDLVKAGALILAEIERIDRMGGSDAE